jgi:hypothetical protein
VYLLMLFLQGLIVKRQSWCVIPLMPKVAKLFM